MKIRIRSIAIVPVMVNNMDRTKYYSKYRKSVSGAEIRKAYTKTQKYKKLRARLKKKYRLKKFVMTMASYELLLKEQNCVCAICSKKDENKMLAVDHNHKTGKVRGLLCSGCNLGIGNFKENTSSLKNAIWYIQEPNENT